MSNSFPVRFRLFVVWNVHTTIFSIFSLVIFVLFMPGLFVLFLVAVISLPPLFFTLSSRRCIDASTLPSLLASPHLLSFLDTYSLCTSSLGSHEFSCSLVHLFKFLPRPLQECSRVSYEGDTSLMRFLLLSLVSSSFFVLLGYSFLIFLSSPLVWWCPLSIFPSICKFLFLRIIIIIILRAIFFYTSVSWLFFSGVLVTVSLFRSPGLFWIFSL